MTASLPPRAANLKGRLSRLHELSAKVQEASDLERLRQDLSRRVEKFEPQMQKQALLEANAVAVASPVMVVKMARRAASVLEKFQMGPTAATLKRGKTWQTLLDELDAAGSELGGAVLTAWRQARRNFFAGDTPATLRGRLARTAENDRALDQYRALHQALDTAFSAAPADQTAIDQVKRLAKQLETTSQAFNFDVPEAVKKFLEAVQSIGGAPLDLLTPEVIDWLKTNRSSDAYRIIARGRA
jgi:hypothetical protein